ncbi:MAG: SAM-dependent methyltransferase, partial [Mycobacterium sp.]
MPPLGGSVDDPGHAGRPGVDAAVGTVNAARFAVQFVGAGPGAADLVTVRATRLLAAADTVLYPG